MVGASCWRTEAGGGMIMGRGPEVPGGKHAWQLREGLYVHDRRVISGATSGERPGRRVLLVGRFPTLRGVESPIVAIGRRDIFTA